MKQVLSCLALVILAATSAGASGNGLYAEYRDLGGSTIVKTVDGEGPLLHGGSYRCLWAGQGFTEYEDQCGLWAGIWDLWGQFEETLTGYVEAPQTGLYTISGTADDYIVVTFQDVVVAEYDAPPQGFFSFEANLVVGQFYKIQIDYKNRWGSNRLGLGWVRPDGVNELIPKAHLYTEIPVIAVAVDIKPGTFPNGINLADQGRLPIAILGSAEFDVATINPETINIGGVTLALRGSAKAPKLAFSYEDVNEDGITDIMAFFDLQTLVAEEVLTGSTVAVEVFCSSWSGTSIAGMDSVNILH